MKLKKLLYLYCTWLIRSQTLILLSMAVVMGTPLLNSSLHCNKTSTVNKILSQMLNKPTNKFKRLFLNNSTVLHPTKSHIHTSNSSLTRKSSLWPNTRKIVLVEKLASPAFEQGQGKIVNSRHFSTLFFMPSHHFFSMTYAICERK